MQSIFTTIHYITDWRTERGRTASHGICSYLELPCYATISVLPC